MYRVMIADDEPIARKGLEVLNDWNKLGCEVVYVAHNGREVIDNIENVAPDIIITDIKMPEVTGIDVARYVYEKGLEIKVILLTGYAKFSYAQSAIKYNVVDYVMKTGAFDGIAAAVKKAQDLIEQEDIKLSIQNKEAMLENFYKSIIDGSLYDKAEIEEKINTLKIGIHKYSVLILNFNLSINKDKIEKVNAQIGLANFLKVAFQGKNPQVIPLSRDLFCIIVELKCDLKDYQTNMKYSCIDVVDMIESFTDLKVCIGISLLNNDIKQLKSVYQQAQDAINMNFAHKQNKINFYSNTSKRNDISSKKCSLVYNCERLIDQELQSNITVSGIARELGVSDSYLSRIFKRKTGSTVINAINVKKIQRAKEYLSNTDMKVHEIANCLDFGNTAYFSDLFKRYTNLSPSDYRKNVDN